MNLHEPVYLPAARRASSRRRRLETISAVLDLALTAIIGLGVIVCFGLVFTML